MASAVTVFLIFFLYFLVVFSASVVLMYGLLIVPRSVISFCIFCANNGLDCLIVMPELMNVLSRTKVPEYHAAGQRMLSWQYIGRLTEEIADSFRLASARSCVPLGQGEEERRREEKILWMQCTLRLATRMSFKTIFAALRVIFSS